MRIGGAGYRALGRGGWGDGCVREREREVCVGWEKGGRRGSSPVETEAGDVCVLDIRATPSRHGVWPCCCLIFCWWTSVLFENWTSFLAPMSREPQQLVNEETRAVCFSLRDKSRLALPCLALPYPGLRDRLLPGSQRERSPPGGLPVADLLVHQTVCPGD